MEINYNLFRQVCPNYRILHCANHEMAVLTVSCLDKNYFSLPIRRYGAIVRHLVLVRRVIIIPDEALLLRICPDGAGAVDSF